jgi:uncharacterized membrane-anchored protein YhcB (DUF1043 family)
MKTQTRVWLMLLMGLVVGYGAGVTTMMQVHRSAASKEPVQAPELIEAKARLAELQKTFTDANPIVQKQLGHIRQLEEQQHKM